MEFSTGWNLASRLGTHYDRNVFEKDYDIDVLSVKPDFMMLICPVVSMNLDITHKSSRDNLLRKTSNDELVSLFSNELHIDEDTPSTFLVIFNK